METFVNALGQVDPDGRFSALTPNPDSVLNNLCNTTEWPDVPIDGPVCRQHVGS